MSIRGKQIRLLPTSMEKIQQERLDLEIYNPVEEPIKDCQFSIDSNTNENICRCVHKLSGAIGFYKGQQPIDKIKDLAYQDMAQSKLFQNWMKEVS